MSIFPADPVIEAVAQKLLARAEHGMAHYGISLHQEHKPLGFWLDNAIEEALDLANYLMKLKMDLAAAEQLRETAADLAYESRQYTLFERRT